MCSGPIFLCRHSRQFFILIACFVAIATQGCIPAPQTTKQAGLNTTAPSNIQTNTTQMATTRPLADLWKAEVFPPRSQSDLARTRVKRIAITEFAVEFVTVRSRGPFDSQLAVKIPPWDPIGAALELVGIGRAETPFEQENRITLTAALFDQLTNRLQSLGYTVLPQSNLRGEPAFEALTRDHPEGESADSSPLDYVRLLSTDVGVINASCAQPAPGTRLANQDQSPEDRRKAELLLLQKTGADATLSVHLLVGCYSSRAAIEQGSRVRVMRVEGREITMTSQRSLLSEKKVRAPGHFMPVVGMVEPVKADVFNREVKALLQPYLANALHDSFDEN